MTWCSRSVQVLRGQDNRFAQTCERQSAKAGLAGFSRAAQNDLRILQQLATVDLVGWMEACERDASSDVEAGWSAAGASRRSRS